MSLETLAIQMLPPEIVSTTTASIAMTAFPILSAFWAQSGNGYFAS